MRSSAPEPEVSFSPVHWTEFAKAVRLGRIPPKEQQEICIAIVAYDFALVENERAADKAEEKNPLAEKLIRGQKALPHFAISSSTLAD